MKQPLHLNRQKSQAGSGTRPSGAQPQGPQLPPTSENDQRQRESVEGEQEGAHGSNYGGLRRPPEPEDDKTRSPF
ncbi:MAG: hypothetical protein V4739_04215 [Pseudomonadota bacterium]